MENDNKKRIFYIDPVFILNEKLSAKKISHKPPQVFSTRLGGDTHEKYHAGQPFSSDRKGNFSSKHIPLFSSPIDNFRINIKLFKVSSAKKKNKDAIFQIAKAVDPGIEGIYSTISGMIKIKQEINRNNIENKDECYSRNLNIAQSNSRQLSKLVGDVCDIKNRLSLPEILLILIKQLKPKEAIHLETIHAISFFFGIASGGIPFSPGWFVGVIGELSKKNNLIISKTENNNVRLSFRNRYKVGGTGLAGTGQGLEKTLLSTATLDYMTVLPVEANIIMVIQSVSENDFSFEMSKENFDKFVMQLINKKEDPELKKLIVDEAEAKENKENRLILKIETKSELRLQAGKKINAITYMVMPRTAVGMRLALNLLDIKYESESTIAQKNKFLLASNGLRITVLKPEVDIFSEWKIMPIAMQQGRDNRLWCYPLPLMEESKSMLSFNIGGIEIDKNKKNDVKPMDPSKKYFMEIDISDVNHTSMFITVNNKGVIKKGLSLKQLSMQNNIISLINDVLKCLKKKLACQEMLSQNKTCFMKVVSYYECIQNTASLAEDVNTETIESVYFNQAKDIEKYKYEKKSFKLKKLEFRKIGSFRHIKNTIPFSILNFSSINEIMYDQYLGEIEFLYRKNSDIVPFDAERRLVILY